MKNSLPQEEPLIVGSLKFTTDYVSKKELYEVLQEAMEEYGDKLRSMTLRTGAPGELAVDLIYEIENLDAQEGRPSSKYLRDSKKYFDEKLGEGCIKGWDITAGAIVLK